MLLVDVALRKIGHKAVSMPDGLAPSEIAFFDCQVLFVFDRHLLNEPV